MASFPRSVLLLGYLGLSLASCQATLVVPTEGRISHLTPQPGASNSKNSTEPSSPHSPSQPAIATGPSTDSTPNLAPIGLPIASRPSSAPGANAASGDCPALVGRVSTFDPRWNLDAFDQFGSTRDLASESVDVTFDGLGNAYYAVQVARLGSTGKVLMKVTPEGKNLFYTPGQGWTPKLTYMMPALLQGAIQADPEGRLYYAYNGIENSTNIYRLSIDGKTVEVFEGTSFAESMAMDARRNLYVIDPMGHRIRRLTADGKSEVVAGDGTAGSSDGRGSAARFDSLSQIVIEPSGNFLVSESTRTEAYRLRRMTPAGEVTTLPLRFRGGGEPKPALINIFGLAVDSRGTIYLADPVGRVVYRGTETGGNLELTAWAGAAGQTGYAEGMGSKARFQLPAKMVMAGCDRLLVFDDGNRVIRQIQ